MAKEKLHERLGMDESEFKPRDEDQPKSLKQADAVSGPYIEDAEPDDPPVRAATPDQPIITSLAVGAGEHKPVDDPRFDPVAGRWSGTDGGAPVTAFEGGEKPKAAGK